MIYLLTMHQLRFIDIQLGSLYDKFSRRYSIESFELLALFFACSASFSKLEGLRLGSKLALQALVGRTDFLDQSAMTKLMTFCVFKLRCLIGHFVKICQCRALPRNSE